MKFHCRHTRTKSAILIIINLFVVISMHCQIVNENVQKLLLKSDILSKNINVELYSLGYVSDKSPLVYFTDGQKMIENGTIDRLRVLIKNKLIQPAHYIFVSTIDPETGEDHRNTYFFCNENFVTFFEQELAPQVEKVLDVEAKPERRSLIGISFGGLNAAYFSGNSDLFKNYALLSPITYPCDTYLKSIAFREGGNLNIFISTGKQDAEHYVKPLKAIYESKGHRIKFLQTEGAHDFKNWNNQLEEVLNFLHQKL